MSQEQLEEALRKLVGEYVNIHAGTENLQMNVYEKLHYEGKDIYFAGIRSDGFARFSSGAVLSVEGNHINIAM